MEHRDRDGARDLNRSEVWFLHTHLILFSMFMFIDIHPSITHCDIDAGFP